MSATERTPTKVETPGTEGMPTMYSAETPLTATHLYQEP